MFGYMFQQSTNIQRHPALPGDTMVSMESRHHPTNSNTLLSSYGSISLLLPIHWSSSNIFILELIHPDSTLVKHSAPWIALTSAVNFCTYVYPCHCLCPDTQLSVFILSPTASKPLHVQCGWDTVATLCNSFTLCSTVQCLFLPPWDCPGSPLFSFRFCISHSLYSGKTPPQTVYVRQER